MVGYHSNYWFKLEHLDCGLQGTYCLPWLLVQGFSFTIKVWFESLGLIGDGGLPFQLLVQAQALGLRAAGDILLAMVVGSQATKVATVGASRRWIDEVEGLWKHRGE